MRYDMVMAMAIFNPISAEADEVSVTSRRLAYEQMKAEGEVENTKAAVAILMKGRGEDEQTIASLTKLGEELMTNERLERKMREWGFTL